GVYGWAAWLRDERRAEPPVRAIPAAWRATLAGALVAVAWAVGALLARHTDAAAPHWDAAASATSLAANQLLTRRYVESWVLWIAADVIYVGLFAWKGLPVSAALYALFLGMAAAGLRAWARERRRADDARA
ncbi:MAG TPA: nicotinamide riboside transporter PnuC, partial [Gemmatimonadaceae bacterium]|nr:nicotinamide riboside transporter PnuC [Gemmatimonadaceae bacterium]